MDDAVGRAHKVGQFGRLYLGTHATWADAPKYRCAPPRGLPRYGYCRSSRYVNKQYAHALRAFDTARIYGNQGQPGVGAALDELRRRRVLTFDNEEPNSWFAGYLGLRPDLAGLWPLPEGLTLTLDSALPFGDPHNEPDENCTEA
ncbi:hypothetical protein [Streptomyces sp. NPDC002769]|uniref:hypothetical protein n=1 Tax=Streptomyces sp. NPDC002769 TaxID=3154542 RepID=UPI0033195769